MHPSTRDTHCAQVAGIHIGSPRQIVDQAPPLVCTQPDDRAAEMKGQHRGVRAGGRHVLAKGRVQVRKVGLPLAKARDLGGGDGKPAPAQRHGKVLVIAIRDVPLLAVLPEADDVFDAVAMPVEGDDHRIWLDALLGPQYVNRHQRIGRGAQQDLFPDIVSSVHLFDLLRIKRHSGQ